MFIGQFNRIIDDNGRVMLPSGLRKKFNKTILISKGYDKKCLYLFPNKFIKKLKQKIEIDSINKESSVDFSRWFLSSLIEEKIDSRGRFRILKNLLSYANIDKEIIILGLIDWAEIWSKKNLSKYYKKLNIFKKPVQFERLDL